MPAGQGLTGVSPLQAVRNLRELPMTGLIRVNDELTKELAENLAILGIGGAIGGGSALFQFRSGQQAREAVDERAQELMSKKSEEHIPTVAIDVDGTLALPYTEFDAKKIPNPRPGAVSALKKFQEKGWRIILWTVRGDKQLLRDYCHEHEIPYDYINENPGQPEGSSDKIIADVYIDDRGVDGAQSWGNIQEQTEKLIAKKANGDAKDEEAGRKEVTSADRAALLKHIAENEDLDDEKMHEFYTELGLNAHAAETALYEELHTRMGGTKEDESHVKEAKIGARETNLKWSKLWFTGTIRAEYGKGGKPWVYVETHGGLVDAALESLKSEGFQVDRTPNDPHITLVGSDETQELIDKYGETKWKGAAKDGTKVRFALSRLVNLVPSGWEGVDRVWFIEVDSPDLRKYRTDLGFDPLPKGDNGNEHRFHITFAVHRPKNEIKRAEYLFGCKRAEAGAGIDRLEGPKLSEHGQGLLDTFNKMGLDPEVTSATLGEGYKNVSVPMLLRTTQKLLNISRQKEDVDDRDSLAYQTLYGPEDFFAERLRKDAGQIGRKLLWRSTLRGSVQHVPTGALSGQLAGVLLRSGMGMPLEEVNPMDIFDQNLRVLRLGEGGIGSLQAVPDDSRNVQPSQFGFIDPIRAPECYDEKTEVFTRAGWKLWADVSKEDEFACRIDGILEFHKASDLYASHYEGPMHHGRTSTVDYMVTPNHRMYFKSKWSEREYIQQAVAMFGRQVRLIACHLPYEGGNFELSLPRLEQTSNAMKQVDSVDPVVWARFIGHYLADGSCVYKEETSNFGVSISAVKARKRELLDVLLPQTPWGWSYSDRAYRCGNKQLSAYLKPFGKSYEKFIPEDLLTAPLEVREALFDALMASDGSIEGGHFDYVTTSFRLAKQVECLAIGLGIPAFLNKPEVDERSDSYHDCHRVRMLTQKYREVKRDQQEVVPYSGMVYCATVPGGLLYVRRERLPFWCGNSEKIGVDSRVTYGTAKGKDGQFYSRLKDARTGELQLISARQAAKSVVAFPGELESDRVKVRAMVNSKQVEYVDRKKVDYELPNSNRMFTASSNLVPMTSAIEGGRLLMGAKYVTQSLPLKNNEAPLVQNLAEPSLSFDQLYGERVGAVRSAGRGVVRSIDRNGITVVYEDGRKETHELYDNFPFNRKTFIHNTPVVKVGDTVSDKQLLAKSNYTDNEGTLAIGTNLRVAYMPYKGLNYEDAIVVSESAARKLSSEHMYQNTLDGDDNREVSRRAFMSLYPTTFTRKQLETIDDKGVVKKGSIVKPGDPLLLAVDRAKRTAVHKGHKPMFSDSSLTWDHDVDGVVTDVDQMDDGGYNVVVRAYTPLMEGDKLAGRYGDKGVVSRIIPDDQMIHDKEGKPYEILLNPQGIISRGNPAQVHEALLGKVARKRGQPYRIPAFMKESFVDFVSKELGKNGLHSNEDLFDPADGGVKIPSILTGERFMYKLHHTAEAKGRGRDVGAYTSEGLPAKGGEFGAKRVSNMEQNALISHGATEVLRDAQVVRGQRNDDYWRAFRLGLSPPSPKVPFVYQKFLGYLTGAGINVKKDGNSLHLFALTDKDVARMSSGAINSAKTVEHDDLKEIAGGLFDRGLTGGHGGNRWAHIELSEPLPNPVMEEPVRRLLGLTKAKYESVLKGEVALGGKIGGNAIKDALKRINVDSALEYYADQVRNGAQSKRDNAVKVLGYLKTLKKHDMKPEDWVMTKVPVLPPHFRPITQFKNMPLVADPNYLYQDLIRSNDDLKEMQGVVGEGQMGRERLKLYNAFKAVSGLGDPVQAKTQEKQAKGLLRHVFGSSPKYGLFQRRVLGSPVDVVGRATITPNPDLNMDQVGLPEPKAWTIYRPFIVRSLIRSGMPAMQAATEVANQTQRARKTMVDEMQRRPVIINRAPTLHRYGFMAAWPVLTKGETLQISPVVTPGFNADFDGDAMNYHVPVTDEAVADAVARMLPSKNLKSSRDFKVHYVPRQEFLLGLYLASSAKNDKKPRIFASKEDVIHAHQRGEIGIADPVIIRK
jgi:DNA-directed RNA polymerase beta subunit